MSPPVPRPTRAIPYRAISRLGNEMALSGAVNLARLAPGDFDTGVILTLLIRQCAPDWIDGDRIAAPREIANAFSINGLAASLARPFETVRRHVGALVRSGLCVATPEGVAIGNAPAAAPAIIAYLEDAHDLLVRLVEDMATVVALPTPPAARTDGPSLEAMVAAALDIHLMPFESFRGKAGSWTTKLLWHGIAVANVRHIVEDPALNARYAFDSTPDAMRRPASIAAVADLLGIPRATAFRHRRMLADANMLAPKGDGWIIQTDQLRRAAIEDSVVASVDYHLRRIGQLIAAGLDPARPADRYIRERRPYVPLR